MNNDFLYDTEYLLKLINYNKNRFLCNLNGVDFVENKDFERSLKARYNKCSRVKQRFIYLLSRYNYIWFVTFTFDKYYITKSNRTQRDLIKNCLNIKDFKYILNSDYGDKTERLHYHCILATNEDIDIDSYLKLNYPCFTCSILCKKGLEDFKRLSKYINKLVNHCLKASTKNQRIFYNFKGYNSFCPTSHDKTMTYHLEYDKLFES